MNNIKHVKMIIFFIIIMYSRCIVYASDLKTTDVNAHGAILMEFDTGRVLWEKDAHKPLAMASTTKIMTAVIALENGNMSDIVTVSALAAAAPEVKMHLSKNEEILLEDLMFALMLQSSNDAAVAIAEHIGGNVESFCKMMTQKAHSIGAVNTVFETPNGLDSENHISTAYDMALIARYALNNKQFVDIINTPSHYAKSSASVYNIINKNRLLNEYSGAFGVKTGFTGKAGHCFVGAAERNGMKIVSVVLASGWGTTGREKKWIDTKKILNYAFDNYSWQMICNKGEDTGDVIVKRSKTDLLKTILSEGLALPMTEKEKESAHISILLPEIVLAPVEKGDIIGTASIIIGNECVKEIDIIAVDNIERHDLKTSAEKVLSAFFEMATNKEMDIVLPEYKLFEMFPES